MASNEWLVRKLHEQDKKIEALSRGGTGVGHTSIAPGENLTVISDNGEVVLGAGGVEHVDGPTPATPSAPTLKLGFGTIETTWDGTFAEGEDEDGVPLTAPVDFDVVEVHCSTDPEEEWGEDTMRGQIKTREGGTITVGGFDVDDEVFVCLIALAKTGKRSAPSATTSLVIEGLDFSALFNELDAANATIKNAGEVLVTEQGTLDEKLTEVDGTLNDLGQDLAAVEDAQAQLNTDLSDVMTSVDGKNTITWNPSAPSKVSSPGKAVGDLWYRTSGNSIVGFWKWDGTDWVTQLLDKTTIPLIDIGAGTFGSLSGVRLEAGTVAASSIAVGDFSNLATIDPVRNVNVTRPENWSTETVGDYITPKAVSQNYLMFKDRTNTVPFKAGDQLRVELKGVSDVNGSALIRLWGYPALADGTTSGLVGVSGDSFNFTTTEQSFSGKVTIPASFGASTTLRSWIIGLGPQGGLDLHGVRVRDVRVYRMTDTTLIQNGAVSTGKLSADVLEVKNLKATSGQLDEAVINKLFSDVVVAKTAVANAFIGENAILTGAVTAPKITASEELWAKIGQFVKIRSEHIEADAIDGMVIRGATMLTPYLRLGDAVEITEGYGIRQFGPDGELNISLPSDGSAATFSGDVRAKSLTTTGRMSIQGQAGVASGAEMQLDSGVTPPAAPPNVSSYVKRTQFPPLAETENAVGLAFDGTHFWRAVDNSVTGGADRMERIDVNGNLVSSFDHYFWVRNGITVIGSEIFALGIEEGDRRDTSKRFIYVYDFTGTLKRKWEYAAYGSGTYQPTIGTDGTDVFVTQCWAEGHASWRRYDKTTGVGMGRYDSDFGLKSDIVSADIGSFDYGSPTMVITKAVESGAVEIYNPTTGAHPDWGGWFAGDREQVRGTAWANGRFHHLTVNGNLVTMSTTKYPNGSTGPDTNDWWAVYTWRDGSNETTISAPRQFTWMRRAGIKLSPGQMPAGVSSVRVYVARKATEPVSTDCKMVATTVADGSLVVQDLGTPNGPPPSSNSFPNSTPGIIRSTLGGFEVKGDGSGHWGPLTFNADGTMTSTQIPAWVPVTSFSTGYSTNTFGYACAYRIWPDGKVEWRGGVRMTGTPASGNDMTAGTADVFTVPVAARPSLAINVTAASTGGVNLRRVEFTSSAAPTMLRVYNGGVTGVWVALDGISYYLT